MLQGPIAWFLSQTLRIRLMRIPVYAFLHASISMIGRCFSILTVPSFFSIGNMTSLFPESSMQPRPEPRLRCPCRSRAARGGGSQHICGDSAQSAVSRRFSFCDVLPVVRPLLFGGGNDAPVRGRHVFIFIFKGHLLREQLHSKFRLEGGPVLIHSGSTTGKRRAAAKREPVREEASRACTMRTIL